MATSSVDNLLHFVSCHFDSLDRQRLNTLLVEFYSIDEFLTSKSVLVAECEKISITDAISECRKKRHNTKSEAHTKQKLSKDILDIWTIVDVHKGGQFQTTFIAADPPRLPSLASAPQTPHSPVPTATTASNDQAHDMKFIISLLHDLREEVSQQNESIRWLTNIVRNIHRRVNSPQNLNASLASMHDESMMETSVHLSLSVTPRSLPAAPSGRAKLRAKRKNLDPLSASFIPTKQNRTTSSPTAFPFPPSLQVAPELPKTSMTPILPAAASNPISVMSATSLVASDPTPTATETVVAATVSATTPKVAVSMPHLETMIAALALDSEPVATTETTASAPPQLVTASSTSTVVAGPNSLDVVPAPPPPPLPPSPHSLTSKSPILPPPRRFADKVVSLKDNRDEWTTVGVRKQKKQAVSGTSNQGGLKGVPNASRDYWQFSVSRLEDKTTADAVKRHLHTAGIEVRDIWMLASKVKGAKTAKIRVAKEHKEKAKDPSLWPIHCQIRDWQFTPKSSVSRI